MRPPGASGWEATAIAYLLDCCPADFRAYRVLRNHPVVLAQFAGHFVNGQHEASQQGLAEVRTSLSEYVEPDVLEAATQAWLEQGLGSPAPDVRWHCWMRRCAAASLFPSCELTERLTCVGPHFDDHGC